LIDKEIALKNKCVSAHKIRKPIQAKAVWKDNLELSFALAHNLTELKFANSFGGTHAAPTGQLQLQF